VKRFEFSLDRLLKVKRQLERLAELEQQRAREAADQARARLTGLREQLDRVAGHYAAAVGRAMTPTQWASASDLSERLGRSIRTGEDEVVAADQKLAAAAQERATLATEVEALSTLRQQQWDRWRQEAKQADQDRLDEVGLRRWMAKQEAEGPADAGAAT
jgi:flagellar export protein FliJ